METTSSFKVTGIPSIEAKRIEISNQVYLVSKHGIAIRSEIICDKTYNRTPMNGGEAIHLHYEESFNLHGKLLEVSAISKTSYGPAGDRLRLDVSYDQEVIGNYRALISYMGGGSNGTWPCIKTKDWILTFSFSSTGFNSKENRLLIEYFKVFIPDMTSEHSINKRKKISSEELTPDFLNQHYTLEELTPHKLIHWLIPALNSNTNMTLGKLSCCSYPGYEQYTKTYYGNLKTIMSIRSENKTFITKALHEDCIVNIEFESDGIIERCSLEGDTYIYYNI